MGSRNGNYEYESEPTMVKRLLALFVFFMSSGTTFAAAEFYVELTGMSHEIVERSIGVNFGIRLSSGRILTPAFTLEEMTAGTVSKKILLEDGESVESCTFNWTILKKLEDIVPRELNNWDFNGNCEAQPGVWNASPSFQVFDLQLDAEATAFTNASARLATLKLDMNAGPGFAYPSQLKVAKRADAPVSFKFKLLAQKPLEYALHVTWFLEDNSRVQDPPRQFQGDHFILN